MILVAVACYFKSFIQAISLFRVQLEGVLLKVLEYIQVKINHLVIV